MITSTKLNAPVVRLFINDNIKKFRKLEATSLKNYILE